MTHNKFVIADTHFSHEGVTRFLRADGTKLRPWDNTQDMDEALVANWNEVVKPHDRVYMLGDVVMRPKDLPILDRLNGRKVLIKGNHDIFPLKKYLPYFDDIRAYHRLDGFWMSHIPIHPESTDRVTANVHGHIHSREVLLPDGTADLRYYCVSVERINYRPIEWSEVTRRIKWSLTD
jgi:calcineurin-like phosphoesterase family protein